MEDPAAAAKRRRRWGIGICLAGCLGIPLLLFILVIIVIAAATGTSEFGPKVAVIRVSGTIRSGRAGGGLLGGAAGAEGVTEELRKAVADRSVKAIVLRINSPGGSVAGSQEIYDEVKRARKAGKVVVASMGDVAASGGYYVASAANQIVAYPGTLTGSIGVIWAHPNLSDLYRKIGAQWQVTKKGKHKDMGAGFRPLTSEEQKMALEMLDDIYRQFVADVAKGRQMKVSQVEQLADGRIYTGNQALKLKLVDKLGNFQSAIELAGKLSGIAGKPRTIEYGRPSLLDILLGDYQTRLRPGRTGLLYNPLAESLTGALED